MDNTCRLRDTAISGTFVLLFTYLPEKQKIPGSISGQKTFVATCCGNPLSIKEQLILAPDINI